MQRRIIAIVITAVSWLLAFGTDKPEESSAHTFPPRPNKTEVWFFRTSEWIDHYVMKDLDTSYIGLPEHSWRIAYTNGMVGIYSTFAAMNTYFRNISLGDAYTRMQTTPSVNIGLQAGFRSFGFGYSWDAMHAYSQNMIFSLGSKRIGIEFMRQTSTNISTSIGHQDPSHVLPLPDSINQARITNTSLNVWYALNSSHYSHNAAIKQSYIQKRTAGSLLLQVNYMSTRVDLSEKMGIVTGNVLGLETHQVGVGLGYGLNYTPNHGKVLLHLSAMAQLVCFSHNLITHVDSLPLQTASLQDTMIATLELHRINSRYPVHVTGSMRAAVAWEINKWVHLSAWAQVNNIRFYAEALNSNFNLSNWNWQANLVLGVRIGAGYARRQRVLEAEEEYLLAEERAILNDARHKSADSTTLIAAAEIRELNAIADSVSAAQVAEAKAAARQLTGQSAKRKRKLRHTALPKWFTDFFYSPRP